MRVFYGLFIVVLAGLMIAAGCTTGGNTPGAASPTPTATPVIPVTTITQKPTPTIQASYDEKIIGAWKTQLEGRKTIYWQFDANGTLKGGNEPGSHEITGNWTSLGFPNLFELNAAGTNSTGVNATYNIVFYYDIDSGVVLTDNPAEAGNWTFIRI